MVRGRWRLLWLGVLAISALSSVFGRLPDESSAQGTTIPIDTVIVIYLENHSFDNLYGLFPGANGLNNAGNAPLQIDLNGTVFPTLPQPTTGSPTTPDTRFPANLPNAPFDIGRFVPPDQKIGDPIHAYYREQYQINGGRNNLFAFFSTTKGLAMGYYDTSQLPLARWAQQYTLADNF